MGPDSDEPLDLRMNAMKCVLQTRPDSSESGSRDRVLPTVHMLPPTSQRDTKHLCYPPWQDWNRLVSHHDEGCPSWQNGRKV